jgi:hypothetical protein
VNGSGVDAPATLSRRQSLGCLGLAAFALCGCVLCIVLGVRCLGGSDLFECIGLLTVFPAAFAAVGLACAAVGLRRFTTTVAGPADGRPQVSFRPGRAAVDRPAARHPRPGTSDEVIRLPGRREAPAEGDSPGEDERA